MRDRVASSARFKSARENLPSKRLSEPVLVLNDQDIQRIGFSSLFGSSIRHGASTLSLGRTHSTSRAENSTPILPVLSSIRGSQNWIPQSVLPLPSLRRGTNAIPF